MPGVIGVITSPTGAVIRDILHRITDRWPCRVIVWPVVVQGDQAAAQVRAAIEGFNAVGAGGPIPRPDLLIVARGGGSVEDLWPFNDEALARSVAAGTIPLISAVGHETDTTLIDFVSDRRGADADGRRRNGHPGSGRPRRVPGRLRAADDLLRCAPGSRAPRSSRRGRRPTSQTGRPVGALDPASGHRLGSPRLGAASRRRRPPLRPHHGPRPRSNRVSSAVRWR